MNCHERPVSFEGWNRDRVHIFAHSPVFNSRARTLSAVRGVCVRLDMCAMVSCARTCESLAKPTTIWPQCIRWIARASHVSIVNIVNRRRRRRWRCAKEVLQTYRCICCTAWSFRLVKLLQKLINSGDCVPTGYCPYWMNDSIDYYYNIEPRFNRESSLLACCCNAHITHTHKHIWIAHGPAWCVYWHIPIMYAA